MSPIRTNNMAMKYKISRDVFNGHIKVICETVAYCSNLEKDEWRMTLVYR